MGDPVAAHHGGIGIEGDLVEWALNIDQWQEEEIDQGHRIKFLAYPRQPVRGEKQSNQRLCEAVLELNANTSMLTC